MTEVDIFVAVKALFSARCKRIEIIMQLQPQPETILSILQSRTPRNFLRLSHSPTNQIPASNGIANMPLFSSDSCASQPSALCAAAAKHDSIAFSILPSFRDTSPHEKHQVEEIDLSTLVASEAIQDSDLSVNADALHPMVIKQPPRDDVVEELVVLHCHCKSWNTNQNIRQPGGLKVLQRAKSLPRDVVT